MQFKTGSMALKIKDKEVDSQLGEWDWTGWPGRNNSQPDTLARASQPEVTPA